MKLIPVLLFLAIPFFVPGQQPHSKKSNTVGFVKQTFTSGIKHTIEKVTKHFLSAKYNLALATTINSKVKNRKQNSSRRRTHRRQSEVQVVMHISVKKYSTFRR